MRLIIFKWLAVAAAAFAAGPAHAVTNFTNVCPNVISAGPFGPGGPGSAAGCTVGITIGVSGLTIETASTNPTLFASVATGGLDYDSIEDELIGVVNGSSFPVNAINLTGGDAFDFDGDGIDLYASLASPANPLDTSCTTMGPGPSCYGGPVGYFTNINAIFSAGTINFDSLAPGTSTYFSLELTDLCTDPTQCSVIFAAEPATIALLSTCLFGLAALRRRRS